MPAPPAVPNTAKVRTRLVDGVTLHTSTITVHYQWGSGVAQNIDMVDLATAVHGVWEGFVATANVTPSLSTIDTTAQDLSSSTAAQGVYSHTTNGGGSASENAAGSALINWQIARRYRGGKPKLFFPGLSEAAMNDQVHLTSSCQGNLLATATALFSGTGPVISLTYPNIGNLHLVNVSMFSGFDNYTKPSGREASRPRLRSVPVVDIIFNAHVPLKVATQRRRLLPS